MLLILSYCFVLFVFFTVFRFRFTGFSIVLFLFSIRFVFLLYLCYGNFWRLLYTYGVGAPFATKNKHFKTYNNESINGASLGAPCIVISLCIMSVTNVLIVFLYTQVLKEQVSYTCRLWIEPTTFSITHCTKAKDYSKLAPALCTIVCSYNN